MPCSWYYYLTVGVVGASILYYLWKYFQGGQYRKDNIRIDGQVVIVTGCNTGLGKETVLDLAKRGAKIYMACRDYKKCETTRLEIIAKTGNSNIYNRELNLDSLESIRKFAKRFKEEESQLHVLMNNAGMVANGRTVTKDGFEITFCVNYLGHFLLTNLLLDTLKASAPSRIINVSSLAHLWGTINKNNLQKERYYFRHAAYAQSKLAQVLFTRELAKRLKNTGVVANSLHPGLVISDIQRDQPKISHFIVMVLLRFFNKTTRSGAQTQIALAVDPDLGKVTGKYFADCKISKESKTAQNDELAAWLWKHSEELVGLTN